MEDFCPLELYLAKFRKEIKDLNSFIKTYANRPDANQTYLQKQYDFINRLNDIHNGLEKEFEVQGIIAPLAKDLHKLMADDPELGTVIIKLVINPKKKGFGLLPYDPSNL